MLLERFSQGFWGRAILKTVILLENWFFPLIVLTMRLWMGRIFWYSGLNKISSWPSTVYLFQYEYKTPFLEAEIAAVFAATFELVCPVLLLLGLASRLAVLPMLSMTAVIQFTYLNSTEHAYWALLLGTILFYGPGRFSLDRLIRKRFDYRVRD